MSGTRPLASQLADARRELAALRRDRQDLERQLVEAHQLLRLAAALAREDADAGDRMERLERILDLEAVTRHVREAIDRVQIVEQPNPCFAVGDLLPAAAVQAAIEAIPTRALQRQGRDRIRVPPPVAPTFANATWLFLNDVARDLIGPAVLRRLQATLPGEEVSRLLLSHSELVRRSASRSGLRAAVLTLVVRLHPPQSGTAWVLHGEAFTAGVPGVDGEAASRGYDWHLSFEVAGGSGKARRRHGDVESWRPRS